jgi:hypothetical protein
MSMRQGECRAGVAESSGGLLWDNRDQGERARETRGTHPALPITHLRSPGSPARAAGGRERQGELRAEMFVFFSAKICKICIELALLWT